MTDGAPTVEALPFDAIPARLRILPRWVAWKAKPPKESGDKFGKLPVNPHTGKLASTTDESTWGTFEQAVARAQQDGLAGVGFVFVAKDRLIGIDLDHCRNPETSVVASWAIEIIERIATYTEVSPSGTGVHLIASGELPPGSRKKDKIEMYCDARFFTMTGQRLDDTSTEVEKRTEAVAALHREVFAGTRGHAHDASKTTGPGTPPDEYIVEKAEAEFGNAFKALWNGDHSSYPSQSEGDLALCGMLARVTNGDSNTIDRLFRRSGLMREKWDSSRGASTYGEITVRKALQEAAKSEAEESDSDGGGKETIAARLLTICDDVGAKFFHDDRQEAYASIEIDGHLRTYRLRDQAFRRWLGYEYHKRTNRVPSSTPLSDACNLLSGRAIHDGPCLEVCVRIGESNGSILLDLGDAGWNVVEISRAGWKTNGKSPIPFRRPPGMRPLPVPIQGGSISELRKFINCTDDDWPLILGWLIAAFRLRGPFAILLILGEQGSAKSTLERVLKRLIDPNAADLRSQPRDGRDLMIAASNCWTLAFDNLSQIPHWLSDAMCRLATGGGFTTRSLYTNDEEMIFDSQRPMILNGIANVLARPDVLDRSIVTSAPSIPPKRRRAEKNLWAEFDAAWPRILGALLDAVVVGLQREASIEPPSLPRMADFVRWVCACEPALGLQPGEFIAAYNRNRENQVEIGIEASVVAQAVRDFIEREQKFEGISSELLERLAAEFSSKRPPADWPKNARELSGELRRVAPALRAVGIDVVFERKAGGQRQRVVRLTRTDGWNGGHPPPDGRDPGSTRDGTQPRDDESGAPSRPDAASAPRENEARDGRDGRDGPRAAFHVTFGDDAPKPTMACSACRGTRFWALTGSTHRVCSRCHPPAGALDITELDVVDESPGEAPERVLRSKYRSAPSRPSRPSRPQEKVRDDGSDSSVPTIVPDGELGR